MAKAGTKVPVTTEAKPETKSAAVQMQMFRPFESLRREDAAENPMDYNTKLEACDPTVRLVVPSETELRKQYDNAMRFYREPPAWADPWPANGRVHPAAKLVELIGGVNQIELPVLV